MIGMSNVRRSRGLAAKVLGHENDSNYTALSASGAMSSFPFFVKECDNYSKSLISAVEAVIASAFDSQWASVHASMMNASFPNIEYKGTDCAVRFMSKREIDKIVQRRLDRLASNVESFNYSHFLKQRLLYMSSVGRGRIFYISSAVLLAGMLICGIAGSIVQHCMGTLQRKKVTFTNNLEKLMGIAFGASFAVIFVLALAYFIAVAVLAKAFIKKHIYDDALVRELNNKDDRPHMFSSSTLERVQSRYGAKFFLSKTQSYKGFDVRTAAISLVIGLTLSGAAGIPLVGIYYRVTYGAQVSDLVFASSVAGVVGASIAAIILLAHACAMIYYNVAPVAGYTQQFRAQGVPGAIEEDVIAVLNKDGDTTGRKVADYGQSPHDKQSGTASQSDDDSVDHSMSDSSVVGVAPLGEQQKSA